MPELPEVETIRRGLHRRVIGQRIAAITLNRTDIVAGDPEALVASLQSEIICDTGRRGKVLWLSCDSAALGVHLGMSGRLQLAEDESHPEHTHLAITLSDGAQILYVDPRRFGRVECFNPQHAVASDLLRNVGIDALDEGWTAPVLLEAATRHSIGLKQFLLDQSHVAGLGNIYVCEILHRAGQSPHTPACDVDREQAQRIIDTTRQVLTEAVEARGTTISDHRDALGRTGGYQEYLCVYGREGEVCTVEGCSGVIQKVVDAGRSTYFCPLCQDCSTRV